MKKYVKYLIVLALTIMGFILINYFDKDYEGVETELSKTYVTDGYAIDLYRSFDMENDSLGKVNMKFRIETKFNSKSNMTEKIQKVEINNVKIISKPKLGNIINLAILERYASNLEDGNLLVKNDKTKYEYEYTNPGFTGTNSIWIELENIASYDLSSNKILNPTQQSIYEYFEINEENIEFTIGFRVVLETVNGTILFKDYEIELPIIEDELYDAKSRYEFYGEKEETFLEKK